MRRAPCWQGSWPGWHSAATRPGALPAACAGRWSPSPWPNQASGHGAVGAGRDAAARTGLPDPIPCCQSRSPSSPPCGSAWPSRCWSCRPRSWAPRCPCWFGPGAPPPASVPPSPRLRHQHRRRHRRRAHRGLLPRARPWGSMRASMAAAMLNVLAAGLAVALAGRIGARRRRRPRHRRRSRRRAPTRRTRRVVLIVFLLVGRVLAGARGDLVPRA